jgi:hypothetical protein
MSLQEQFLSVYGQSDIDIYIIGSPLIDVSLTVTIRWLWTELQAGEFPQMRNYERIPKLHSRSVMLKVTSTYTLLGRL